MSEVSNIENSENSLSETIDEIDNTIALTKPKKKMSPNQLANLKIGAEKRRANIAAKKEIKLYEAQKALLEKEGIISTRENEQATLRDRQQASELPRQKEIKKIIKKIIKKELEKDSDSDTDSDSSSGSDGGNWGNGGCSPAPQMQYSKSKKTSKNKNNDENIIYDYTPAVRRQQPAQQNNLINWRNCFI